MFIYAEIKHNCKRRNWAQDAGKGGFIWAKGYSWLKKHGWHGLQSVFSIAQAVETCGHHSQETSYYISAGKFVPNS